MSSYINGDDMDHKSAQQDKESFEAKITFSGAGVLHIKSSDLVKTQQARRQIEALGKLIEKEGFLTSGQ